MAFVKSFREFALRGNVIDLAVAVVIGAAFAAIVSSLVEDVISPLLLAPALKAAGAENLDQLVWNGVKWGKFLSSVLKFLIVALVLFMIIQGVTRLRRPKLSAEPMPVIQEVSLSEKLLMEIRDSLKK
ncbi:MAG: large conductance mechanosensitive channel protein MscL [Chitinophagaceae bacterium]